MARRGTGTRPQSFPITDLLEWINEQHLYLPEFQRDYDWDDERVLALLATIIRGWPAGSLLLEEVNKSPFFRLRPFDDGPSLDEARADMVVLDGQQRLTALFHAIYDAGSTVYAIRATQVTRDQPVDLLEEHMAAFKRDRWDSTHRNGEFDPDPQAEKDWIPFYALRSAPDYFAWRDDAATRSNDPERAALVISDAYRNGLERFHNYALPAVIVESELEPAAIARIFERVNRQGLALKTFDLMVARTFAPDWNLRDRWADAAASHPVLERFFKDDGMPVIRAIALTTLENVREQAVLNMPPQAVRVQWDDAVEAMARALEFLENSCGVANPDWLPYPGIGITLAAVEREHRLLDQEEAMVGWFLSRGFGLRFGTAANTVTIDEYKHLNRVFDGEEAVKKIGISRRVLQEATRKRHKAIWSTYLCCLSIAGATRHGLGLGEEEAMEPTPIIEAEEPAPGLESPHQRVFNLVLTDKQGARKIDKEGLPSLVSQLDSLAPSTREKVIRSQLLPSELSSDMTPTEFVNARVATLEQWLRPRLGYGFEFSEKT
jgi:Protein of unknown function DUF262